MVQPDIPGGYIMLARKIRRSTLWKSLKATHKIVMIEILLQAQHEDGTVIRNGEAIFLKRGQLATSYQHLVDDIADRQITVKVVRNAIKKLVKYDFLAKDEAKARAKLGLLLTVTNYCIYQNAENYKGKDKAKEKGEGRGKAGAIKNNSNNEVNNLISIVPYKEIINYLNQRTGKNFRYTSSATQRDINARWNEGFRLEDFKKVIENKVASWSGSEYEQYLRPQTLFSNKFEGYLNEKPQKQSERFEGVKM